MINYKRKIRDYIGIERSILASLDVESINDVVNLFEAKRQSGNTVFVFGNGGSGATASHLQNDLNKGVSEYCAQKFNVICLNDNIPTVLAIANDIGYEEIFRFQLQGHVKKGDIVLAISGSGNSKNVINAVQYAKMNGAIIIGMTGFDGGRLMKLSDINLHVPINNMQVTEDLHLVLNHIIMYILLQEHTISKDNGKREHDNE